MFNSLIAALQRKMFGKWHRPSQREIGQLRRSSLKHRSLALLLAFLSILLLISCANSGSEATGDASVDDETPDGRAVTRSPAEPGEYWSGGQWAGHPVVSRVHGPTLEALNEAEKCAFSEFLVEQVIQDHLSMHPEGGTSRIEQHQRVAGKEDEVWVDVLYVKTIANDVYLLTCEPDARED